MRLSLGIERVSGIGNYVFRCQLLQLIRRACVSVPSNRDVPGYRGGIAGCESDLPKLP